MTKKADSYEDMFENLQNIVNKMDDGELTLEDSLKNYENGIKLCNKLYKILNAAEGKVSVLKNNQEEEFKISEE